MGTNATAISRTLRRNGHDRLVVREWGDCILAEVRPNSRFDTRPDTDADRMARAESAARTLNALGYASATAHKTLPGGTYGRPVIIIDKLEA